jgi:hypothetical protein
MLNGEMQCNKRSHTWDLVPRPPNTNVIQNKWIFWVKHNADGSLDRYKARLVTKGFTQQFGLDKTETFSPVIKFPTVRTVITLAATHGWFIRQLDISNAFLHGHPNQDLYMEQPTSFRNAAQPDHVCKLRRSIYGLKQAPRAWFARLSQFLHSLGFLSSKADHSLFLYTRTPFKLFVLVYVDDILVTGNATSAINCFF